MMEGVTDAIAAGLVLSCHDISDGGLVTAVAEMLLNSPEDLAVGVEITVDTCADCAPEPMDATRAAEALFCENGGYVLEVAPERVHEVAAYLKKRGAWFREIGMTTVTPGLSLRGGVRLELSMDEIRDAWTNGASELML